MHSREKLKKKYMKELHLHLNRYTCTRTIPDSGDFEYFNMA